MIEEGFCFPADEVIFLMVVGRGEKRLGDGKVAMETGVSECFGFGGRVLMLKS